MSEILLLNPRRKASKRKTKTKTRQRPAKKRSVQRKPATKKVAAKKGSKMAGKKKAAKKRAAPKRNPASRRRRRRRNPIGSRAKGAIGGLNVKTALKNIPISTIGMFAAKWAAKRFGTAATETDPTTWNYASYLKGSGGAAVAGFIANMVKPGWGQKVLEGGMSLMLYKLVQNEMIPNSTFWTAQLGQADQPYREPGVIETNSAGEPYILGEDYEWHPLEGVDDYRFQPSYSDALVTPGPLGEALVEPGPLGYAGADLDDLYAKSFLRR